MQDETMQDAVKAILLVLSDKYPNLYRADGLNPMSNRIAGYIMCEIVERQAKDKLDSSQPWTWQKYSTTKPFEVT